jgi:hypothetical protein
LLKIVVPLSETNQLGRTGHRVRKTDLSENDFKVLDNLKNRKYQVEMELERVRKMAALSQTCIDMKKY